MFCDVLMSIVLAKFRQRQRPTRPEKDCAMHRNERNIVEKPAGDDAIWPFQSKLLQESRQVRGGGRRRGHIKHFFRFLEPVL